MELDVLDTCVAFVDLGHHMLQVGQEEVPSEY